MLEAYPKPGRRPKQFLAELVFACAASALLACSSATHTVGQIEANSELGGRGALPAGGSGGRGAPREAGAGGVGSGSPSVDAGAAAAPATQPDGAFACGSAPLDAARKRLDLYLMVDSGINIINFDPKTTLLAGIGNYVANDAAAGTGVAVDYFGIECSAGTYATPTVAMDVLPDNAAAIEASFDTVLVFNSSPLEPGLQGAVSYAKSRANAYPDAKQAVVLITDGFVNLACGTTDQLGLEQTAASGAQQPPAVETYVVAVEVPDLGDLINPLTRFDPLDAIAREGATGVARHVDLQDAATALATALLEIQREAAPCEFAVPPEVREDPDRLSLGMLEDPSVTPAALEQLAIAADCGDGYYLDANAQWLTLCPSVCDALKQSGASLIWFSDC